MFNEITEIEIEELKLQFADGILRNPENPWDVAKSLTEDNSLALKMTQLWVKDPLVISEKERLLNERGKTAFLPDKDDFAREVITEGRKVRDPDTKHKYLRLYADTRGFIEKPTTNINTNVQNVTNRVMMVPASSTDEEWANKLKNQQQRLAQEAKSSD